MWFHTNKSVPFFSLVTARCFRRGVLRSGVTSFAPNFPQVVALDSFLRSSDFFWGGMGECMLNFRKHAQPPKFLPPQKRGGFFGRWYITLWLEERPASTKIRKTLKLYDRIPWGRGLRVWVWKLWGCNLTYSCLLSQASPNKPHKHLNYILCQHHTRVAGTESLPLMVQNFRGVHLDVSAQSGWPSKTTRKFIFS